MEWKALVCSQKPQGLLPEAPVPAPVSQILGSPSDRTNWAVSAWVAWSLICLKESSLIPH